MGYFSIKQMVKMKMLGVGNERLSILPGLNQVQFEGFCRFPSNWIPTICRNIAIGRTLNKSKKMLYMNH